MRVNEFIFRNCNLTKMNFSVEMFEEFYLKVSEDFFYGTSPCIFVYLHDLFKIIQNYVNNKINN